MHIWQVVAANAAQERPKIGSISFTNGKSLLSELVGRQFQGIDVIEKKKRL